MGVGGDEIYKQNAWTFKMEASEGLLNNYSFNFFALIVPVARYEVEGHKTPKRDLALSFNMAYAACRSRVLPCLSGTRLLGSSRSAGLVATQIPVRNLVFSFPQWDSGSPELPSPRKTGTRRKKTATDTPQQSKDSSNSDVPKTEARKLTETSTSETNADPPRPDSATSPEAVLVRRPPPETGLSIPSDREGIRQSVAHAQNRRADLHQSTMAQANKALLQAQASSSSRPDQSEDLSMEEDAEGAEDTPLDFDLEPELAMPSADDKADPELCFSFGNAPSTQTRFSENLRRMEETMEAYPAMWSQPASIQRQMQETHQDFPHLPAVQVWKKVFELPRSGGKFNSQHAVNHYFLSNSATVERVVSCLKLDQGPPRVILEGYAGAGTVTQRLMRHPNVEQVIALEDTFSYWAWLRRLEDPPAHAGINGNKLTVFPFSAWEWNSYSDLERGGALDHALRNTTALPSRKSQDTNSTFESPDWKALPPLEVFLTIPNAVLGEQLVAQLIASVGTRAWLFRYGRIKLHLLITESLADRMVNPPGTWQRSKISVMTDAVATVDYHMNGDDFLPLPNHIYPSDGISVGKSVYKLLSKSVYAPKSDNSASGLNRQRLAFITLTPREKPLVDTSLYPTFDWVMKHALVMRSNTIQQSFRHVAPGADEIVLRMSDKNSEFVRSPEEVINPQSRVCDLTTPQLVALARVFDIWPFKPPEVEAEIRNGAMLV